MTHIRLISYSLAVVLLLEQLIRVDCSFIEAIESARVLTLPKTATEALKPTVETAHVGRYGTGAYIPTPHARLPDLPGKGGSSEYSKTILDKSLPEQPHYRSRFQPNSYTSYVPLPDRNGGRSSKYPQQMLGNIPQHHSYRFGGGPSSRVQPNSYSSKPPPPAGNSRFLQNMPGQSLPERPLYRPKLNSQPTPPVLDSTTRLKGPPVVGKPLSPPGFPAKRPSFSKTPSTSPGFPETRTPDVLPKEAEKLLPSDLLSQLNAPGAE